MTFDQGADMNGGILSAKHSGDTIACSECLDVLRCGDKERTCRELALICSAIKEDEETMVQLGLEGVTVSCIGCFCQRTKMCLR